MEVLLKPTDPKGSEFSMATLEVQLKMGQSLCTIIRHRTNMERKIKQKKTVVLKLELSNSLTPDIDINANLMCKMNSYSHIIQL